MEKTKLEKFAEDAEGCGDKAFKFGCAWTLLMIIVGGLLFLLGII